MNIKPIKDLRNTNEISKEAHETNEPIFITKNGYSDLVVLSDEAYSKLLNKNSTIETKSIINNICYEVQESNYGFLNVCSTPLNGKIANIEHNAKEIINSVLKHNEMGVNLIVFPELALTSYTCGDLFLSSSIKDKLDTNIKYILNETKNLETLIIFGSPYVHEGKLYNTAFVCFKGKVLGIVPKNNYSDYEYESKYFSLPNNINYTQFLDQKIPFNTNLVFINTKYKNETIKIEFSSSLYLSGASNSSASIVVNLSATNETITSEKERETLLKSASLKNRCAYIYSSTSLNESTTDVLYSGACLVLENGEIINKNNLFSNDAVISTIDLNLIENIRTKNKFNSNNNELIIPFSCSINKNFYREYTKTPFLENNREEKYNTYDKLINMQALALAKRLKSTNISKVVLGLSGGLDSTLAYLVCVRVMDILSLPHENVIAITLPCFGTSSRTKENAEMLAKIYNTTFIEIPIKDAVVQHLKDIDHDINNKNTTYENSQARERTQVLMDYSNKVNGLVIGTGDLSELALGWCTYNGDHMSMYSVNGSLPKTLIRDMILYLSSKSAAKDVLLDILDTPVSPELLPPDEQGKIAQLTEEVVGPYILHDFFIYHLMKHNFSISKIYTITLNTFSDMFDEETIKKWLKFFVRRFFNQQFKRNCMSDGIKVTDISFSPRGDLKMASDADSSSFLNELE